jgi:hypothetical protein
MICGLTSIADGDGVTGKSSTLSSLAVLAEAVFAGVVFAAVALLVAAALAAVGFAGEAATPPGRATPDLAPLAVEVPAFVPEAAGLEAGLEPVGFEEDGPAVAINTIPYAAPT